ncbi:MAG TPA: FAD:protein FMN transferase [Rheinheimera sp.]|uniref:FAD:protein FMN transferase n=1 Tax=Rheinheimera sp. TaxID=1869214 RepID=UPI000EE55228|nr:FAD:protein FMN transferase [Rheinheimera sp.]HCU64871.1 FAD:protein FMN transferase [Rheinheimera sp.]
MLSAFNRVVLLFSAATLFSCTPADPIQKFSGPAQGSTYNISFWSEQPVDAAALKKQVEAELERIDLAMSNYRSDSVIEKFNQQQSTEAVEVGTELVQLVEQARFVSSQSQGCYDLTVKPLFELWGFKADKFNQPTEQQLADTLALIGMEKIQQRSPSMLAKQVPQLRVDVSSIAQGWTVAQLAKILEQAGVQNYLVEVGGELQVKGKKPQQQAWKVAIEKPLPGSQTLQKVITVQQSEPMAVMTSGTYRHYFDADGKRYSHVLDARIGAPVKHNTVSTTVLIENPTLGDAWSTAFLCMGSQDGKAVADRLGMKVLFIDQIGDELVEISSEALSNTKTVTMQ